MSDFQKEIADRIATIVCDTPFRRKAAAFLQASVESKYSYNFVWLGRSIVQYPQGIVAMLELSEHNRKAIEAHPMASRIQIIQGSSIDADIIKQVHEIAVGYKRVPVCIDSNHTHDHAMAELHACASLTSRGNYCMIFDTLIQDIPKEVYPDRTSGPGNNPKTAAWEFLKTAPEFEIDKSIPDKLQITVAPNGYLKRHMRPCRRARSPVGRF